MMRGVVEVLAWWTAIAVVVAVVLHLCGSPRRREKRDAERREQRLVELRRRRSMYTHPSYRR